MARSEVVGRWEKKRIGGKVGERAQGRVSRASSWGDVVVLVNKGGGKLGMGHSRSGH